MKLGKILFCFENEESKESMKIVWRERCLLGAVKVNVGWGFRVKLASMN